MLAYEFGPMRLEVSEHLLTCKGEPVPLPPRLFQILLTLVENEGRLVPQEVLRNRVWPNSFVEDAAVSKNVSSLRTVLRACLVDVEAIGTAPKRGYQFLLPVTRIEQVVAPALPVESTPALVAPTAPGRKIFPPDTLKAGPRRSPWLIANLAVLGIVVLSALLAATLRQGRTSSIANHRSALRRPDSELISISTVDPDPTPVESTSLHQVVMTFDSKVTLHPTLATAIQVVTQGVANADFRYADGGTCAAGTTHDAGQTCTVNYTFSPRTPGQRAGAVLLQSESAALAPVLTKLFTRSGTGPLVARDYGRISTIVGGSAKLGGVTLSNNQGIAVDPAGVLFIADASNQRVLRVSNGIALQYGPDFSAPVALSLDGAGNVYVADFATGSVSRIDRTGHSQIVTGATGLRHINGMTVDAMANLYVSAGGLNVVRRVSPDGSVRTIAGSGVEGYNGDNMLATSARLANPTGLAVDPAGNVYVEDTGNQRIRKIDPKGVITTVAGNGQTGSSGDGGPATAAKLSGPLMQICLDAEGNLFFNVYHEHRVREVNASSGSISTVAGNGTSSLKEGVVPTASGLNGNAGLAMDYAGNLYISQNISNVVQKVDASILPEADAKVLTPHPQKR